MTHDGRFDGSAHWWDITGKVYWSMDNTPEETNFINRCDEAQTYEARLAASTLPKQQRVPAR